MAFKSHFSIAGRKIGSSEPVLFIAEAGVSHFGDPDKALALVDLAADAGADVFKTQAFRTDALVSRRLPEWRERLRSKEVGFDFLKRMKQRCDERGISFMCTAHDETVLPWLDELDVPAFKIGSGERGNVPYFAELARRGKPVVLSTGLYREQDVRQAVEVFAANGCQELALLHCVTSYPIPYDQVNLRAIESLRRLFPGPVGYSDHTAGHHAVLAAVALGASIVEKHITLDFNVPNAQDWKVAAGPDDLATLVRHVREVEASLGDGRLRVQDCEEPALNWALKSLVARRHLPAGDTVRQDDLSVKRPGDGIAPAEIHRVVGRVLKRDVAEDQALEWVDLE